MEFNKKNWVGITAVRRYLSPHRRELVALSFLGILAAITNGAIPLLTGRLIDAIITPQSVLVGTKLLPLVLILLAGWLIIQAIETTLSWTLNRRSESFGIALFGAYIVESYAHLIRLPLSFHKKHRVGEYTNKLWRTANALETIGGRIIVGMAPQLLTIVVALVVSYAINPLLATIMLAGVIIYVGIMKYSITPLMTLERKMHDTWTKAFGDAYDAVANVSAVKQVTAENHEIGKIRNLFLVRASKLYLELTGAWKNLNFYQRIIIVLTQLVIFGVSISAIANHTMTVGDLVMFNAYAGILFGPFVTLAHNWQTVQNGLVSLEKADKVLFTPEENYHPESAPAMENLAGDIVLSGVDYYYNKDKPILRNINLEIRVGEVVALVGESGVGKSTLIDLISGYHFAKKGRVLIDNHDVRNLDLTFLRSQIAVVPQEVVLFNDTIKMNIKYGNFTADDQALEEAARQAHALEFIEKFPKKWRQVVGERGVKLSVGQKQRVAIARAILRNPKILILDEPTSALDAKSESIIQESLNQLMRGRTTFIIAHRLSTVRRADKIVVIKEGEIVEIGRHDDLIARDGGIYRQLYELQIGLHS